MRENTDQKNSEYGHAVSNETQAFFKKEPFIRRSHIQIKISKKKKNEVVNGKTPFYGIGPFLYSPFHLPYHWLLTGGFYMEMLRFQLHFVDLKKGTPVFKRGFCFSQNLFPS